MKHRSTTGTKAMVNAAPQKQGQPYRHIIRQFVLGDRVYFLHATKGWRSESLKRHNA